jgi:hypothetical protein
LYAPSELLAQVKQQAKAEFGDQIIGFEWFYEQEYTTIMVKIRETMMHIPVGDRIGEIVNEIIGDGYIVVVSLTSIESVGCTDGLFNLKFNGGIDVFFIEYYAPERPTEKPFRLTAFYSKMFEAVRTIHFDSPSQLWRRLVSPAREVLAKQKGVTSFTKEILAADLRDFLIEHLDFIKHIAEATREPLHIFEPTSQPTTTIQSSNGTEPEQLETPQSDADSPVQAALSLLQTEEQRRTLLAHLLQMSQTVGTVEAPVPA